MFARLKLNRLPACLVYGILFGDTLAFAVAIDAPFEIICTFTMDLDLAIDAHLVSQPAVRLKDHGRKAPLVLQFYFFDYVDAISVMRRVAGTKDSGTHNGYPLTGRRVQFIRNWTPKWTPSSSVVDSVGTW